LVLADGTSRQLFPIMFFVSGLEGRKVGRMGVGRRKKKNRRKGKGEGKGSGRKRARKEE